MQLYACAPQILLPILPHVGGELDAEEERRRKDAIQLVAQLMMAPGSDVAEQHPSLLDRFLKRWVRTLYP